MHSEPAPLDAPVQSSAKDPFGLVGTLLERKYRVDRVVAAGGFAIVYEGRHLALGTAIAVKVLRPEPAMDGAARDERLARFLDEAKTIARLRHPSIVSVLDAGVTMRDDEPVPWMVLEWLDGETWHDELRARRGKGGRSPRACLAVLRPVFLAIAEAHDAGIAHRDLKPNNLMHVRTAHGLEPRVLDFGIAKVMEGDEPASRVDTATRDAFKAFSMSHAAPEQLAGTRTGPWTDVHALGLLLTELLTDTAPYDDGDRATTMTRALEERRPTPARRGVDVGPWESILERALSLRPAERHASARALLLALEESLERAERSFAGRPARRPSRRWIAAAAALTVTGAIGATIELTPHPSQARAITPSSEAPASSDATREEKLPTSILTPAPVVEQTPTSIAPRAASAAQGKPVVRPPAVRGEPTVAPSASSAPSASPKVEVPTWLD